MSKENNKEKMTVKEFVDKYNTLVGDKTKEAMIDNIIKRHYAPITEKKAVLDIIFKKCIQEKDGIEYVDKFLLQVGLMSVVLSLYTNIDCNGNMFENYDLLMENEIYPLIIYKIGERDIKELMSVYSSVEETFMNQQSFEAYLAKQVTRFGELVGRVGGSGMEQLAKVLEDEKTMNKIVNNDKFKEVLKMIK